MELTICHDSSSGNDTDGAPTNQNYGIGAEDFQDMQMNTLEVVDS